jgi:hypothetical protein
MSTTAAMTFRLAPLGPGFLGPVYESSRRYFRVVSARWRRRSVEGFQDDGGSDQPARAYEQRTCRRPPDHPIAEAEVGERRREPIENQQLLLGEDGHNGTAPTGRASLATAVQEVEH